MKILLLVLAIFMLSACSFRGWDPPNYSRSFCIPAGASQNGSCAMPHIPLVQMDETKA